MKIALERLAVALGVLTVVVLAWFWSSQVAEVRETLALMAR
jgi:hypothetical protein